MNVFCNVCRKETSHDKLTVDDYNVVLGSQEFPTGGGEIYTSSSWKRYALFRCVVCSQNTVFVVQDCCTENDGSPYGDKEVFPKPSEKLVPDWHIRLNNTEVTDLMLQSTKAFNEGLYSLALMGYRTIIDSWLTSKLGDVGGFKAKLDKACENQLISSTRRDELDVLVQAGSAATHRGWSSDKATTNKVLNCVETILYETLPNIDIQGDISHIRSATPARSAIST